MSKARIEELERELAQLRRELGQFDGQEPLEPAAARALQRVLNDRIVLENLPDIVAVIDRDRTVLYLNRTIPGRNTAEFVGQSMLVTMPLEQQPASAQTFHEAWSSGQPRTMEFTTLSGYWWQTRFIPVKEAGEVVLMLSTSSDCTERVLAERALRESEGRLRHAVDVVGMGTWTHDWHADAVVMDEAMRVIFDASPEQLPTTFEQVMRAVHPDDAPRVLASFTHARLTGEYEDLEHRIVRPSGEIRHVLVKGSTTHDAQGTPTGSLGAVFDVTTRRRLEDQLYQGQKMEAIGELTAGIAHNFNNLLSIILPNVTMCIDAAPPALITRLVDIEHAAHRAADLVRQLMLFARRDSAAHKTVVDPLSVVRRTVEICRTTFDRGITIELDATEGAVPPVLAHEGQLEQVLLNICINARDAFADGTTASPKLTIRVQRSQRGGASIRVRDNGPGMDEPVRARVFEPFFTTKGVGRGTGLGLASAYAIVRDHGGQLACDSTLGEGTTFQIDLPAAPQSATQPLQPSAAKPKPQRGSETVLIVDDEPLVRRATRAMLEHGGYRVLECGDGAQTLQLFEREGAQIDLVLLDRSMPGMSGDQVFAALRAQACAAPIVLLSGHVAENATAELAAAVLSKPVGLSLLLDTIRSALDAV